MTAVPANQTQTGTPALTNRQRFLNASHCREADRPPVWLMRQAGRALPEYRKLKGKHSFLALVRTPELAAEVTLQPIQRFDFDAAILFSDILVVAEGLGQGYKFRDGGGVQMDFELRTTDDIRDLDVAAVQDRLAYVPRALELVKSSLGDKTAVIGFAGSPWTLANFMLEGGSAKEYTQAKKIPLSDRPAREECDHISRRQPMQSALLKKLVLSVRNFLEAQLAAGADAVQIFDSLGGLLSGDAFTAASARWIKQIVAALKNTVPVIVFSKDVHDNWATLVDTGANVLGIDWTLRLADVRAKLPEHVGVQGNLDPSLLLTKPEIVAAETSRILTEMRGARGHIFNLGHGVPPEARLENIAALVETAKNFK